MICRCTPDGYRLRFFSFPKGSVAAWPRTPLHTVTLLPRAPKPSLAGQTFVPARASSEAHLSSPSWGRCLLWAESFHFPGWVQVCFRILLRWWATWAFSLTPLEHTKEVSQPRKHFWSTKAWSSRLMEILTWGNQIGGCLGWSISFFSNSYSLWLCLSLWSEKHGPEHPPPPLFKTREEVPCLTVWLTNFHVLVSLWGVGQLFGRGCKSDGFFFKKVPKLCRLQMGRFALGQLRHAQHKYKAELIVCYRHTPPHQIMFICRSKWKEQ